MDAARATIAGGRTSRSPSSAAYEYTVEGWIDRFETWRQELSKKAAAGQDVSSELLEGAALVRAAHGRTRAAARRQVLADAVATLEDTSRPSRARLTVALSPELAQHMAAAADRSRATRYERVLSVLVERERARFGAWYEMFPRSAGTDPTRSATFDEAAARLPYVSPMGFDVLYLPPIHPIGRSFRKGRNNSLTPLPDDPGSPWAIGAAEGGHTAVEPGLGTLEDFDRFVDAARRNGLEIALDIAFQARRIIRRSRASGVVPASARRHDQVRGEPAEEVSGHLPVRLRVATTGARSGTSCARDRVLDRARRPDLPRRQPAHQAVRVLGVGARRRPDAGIRTRSSSSRRSRGRSDAVSREGRLLAVVHVLHLAQHEGRADGVLHRADRQTESASTCGRTCSRTRPTSCTSTCSAAAARRSRRGWCSPRRSAPATASTAASSCSRTCPCRPGSEEYLDSEKYQIRPRDFERARQPRGADRPRQRDPPRAPRAAVRSGRSRSTRPTTLS